ncbi:MAG: hypothetical protein C0410_05500 [Anaerolinea sp.]|nr:hypothetical protein [Anaerolinea sp.]
MISESIKTFAIPLSLYIVMGIIITRIQLDKTSTREFRWLQWMQYGVDVLRIVFMWPLILFIEKSQSWLEKSASSEELSPAKETTQAHI